jgi:threonine synthase
MYFMKYYSLLHNSPEVDFKTATLLGQAPDKGLYFPEFIPQWDSTFIDSIKDLSLEEMAFQVMAPYVGETIPEDILRKIVTETLSFDIPLVRVTENIYSLELFHGPTLAFKDVGARFMSRCLGYFVRDIKKKVVVLVATSGDTGGAVANGFYDVPGIDVVILYPSGKVSPVQEKQLTTLGKNIHALEVLGNFDDCQRIVKTAFADNELTKNIFLTSANSINVSRWLPQQLYYLLAWKQWPHKDYPPVISVPSGNFGNICAGLIAFKSGLPVDHFIAACNINDVVPRYMHGENYSPRRALPTLSNAMDVGDPSNFIRILELFGQSLPELTKRFSSESISDSETEQTILKVYNEAGYLLDPHGAVGYLALERYLADHSKKKGFFLETAHPVKFPESVERITGKIIRVPEEVKPMMLAEKKSTLIQAEYSNLKEFLINF